MCVFPIVITSYPVKTVDVCLYRASPSSFVVPVEKLTASVSNKLSVGMRFKMKFEGDDATERRLVICMLCVLKAESTQHML